MSKSFDVLTVSDLAEKYTAELNLPDVLSWEKATRLIEQAFATAFLMGNGIGKLEAGRMTAGQFARLKLATAEHDDLHSTTS